MTTFAMNDMRRLVKMMRRASLPVESLVGFGYYHGLKIGDVLEDVCIDIECRDSPRPMMVVGVPNPTCAWLAVPPRWWFVKRAFRIAIPWFLVMAAIVFLVSCGGGQAVKTVNVDRVTTNTVAIPKTALCPKAEEFPALPVRTPVPENASTDQLAAASAADREAFIRYATAVDAMFKRCAEGVPK